MGQNSASRRVIVNFHAGYKAEEEPRKIKADEEEWMVDAILERKRILDPKTGESHEEFTCIVNKKLARLAIYPDSRHYLTFLKS